MSEKRKVILYIASSLDGYIAAPGDDLSFLDNLDHGSDDYGYADFMKGVDTMIMGRKTFDWVVKEVGKYPHEEKTYVLSSQNKESNDNVIFYSDGIEKLMKEIHSEEGGNIFCVGGSKVIQEFLELKCLDEIILSIAPVLLGSGTPLFLEISKSIQLSLLKSESYKSGMAQLHYKVNY